MNENETKKVKTEFYRRNTYKKNSKHFEMRPNFKYLAVNILG